MTVRELFEFLSPYGLDKDVAVFHEDSDDHYDISSVTTDDKGNAVINCDIYREKNMTVGELSDILSGHEKTTPVVVFDEETEKTYTISSVTTDDKANVVISPDW